MSTRKVIRRMLCEAQDTVPWSWDREEYRDRHPDWIAVVEYDRERGIRPGNNPERSHVAQKIYAEHWKQVLERVENGNYPPDGHPLNEHPDIKRIRFRNELQDQFPRDEIIHAYHGSSGLDVINSPDAIGAIYFSSDPAIARWFSILGSESSSGRRVSEVFLRVRNLLRVDASGIEAGRNPDWIRNVWAEKGKHDGVALEGISESGYHGTTYMVESYDQVSVYRTEQVT